MRAAALLASHPLEAGAPPRWASEWGEDEWGVFVGFRVGGAVQRMRWIRPGPFSMGSPETEAGRWDNEGPEHEVVLTRGYWLADTPCTQAVWTAVMSANPSRFQSPTRPVEQVSWEECKAFFERLNAQVEGLEARFPTEAEWEYACRAGTRTSTYAGQLVIQGDSNGPILDDIAWYAGNSGVGFDLEEFEDSSRWPRKQYPHKRAGTRPVAMKRPNDWGLYDMLGNVWEWCADWRGPYAADRGVDPTGPALGSDRVLRGGSWLANARHVRAAFRLGYSPDDRSSGIGFRLARGQ